MTDTMFADAVIADTIPETEDVEYPCQERLPDGSVCGRESGPYGGRGPKPKKCPDHKKVASGTRGTRTPRVTGNASNLAAQAAGVLTQLNQIITIGMMAVGLNQTASAMASCADTFHENAYNALLTDPELCKYLLRGGVQSAKVSLGIAYVGMGSIVVPTAVNEIRAKRDEKRAREEAETGE